MYEIKFLKRTLVHKPDDPYYLKHIFRIGEVHQIDDETGEKLIKQKLCELVRIIEDQKVIKIKKSKNK